MRNAGKNTFFSFRINMYFLALNTFREIARSRAFIFIGILTLLMFFGIVILNTLAL